MAWAYRRPAGGGWFVWLGRGEKSFSSGDVEASPISSSRDALLSAWAESTGHRRVTLCVCKAYSTRLELWTRRGCLPSALGLTCIFTRVRIGLGSPGAGIQAILV